MSSAATPVSLRTISIIWEAWAEVRASVLSTPTLTLLLCTFTMQSVKPFTFMSQSTSNAFSMAVVRAIFCSWASLRVSASVFSLPMISFK